MKVTRILSKIFFYIFLALDILVFSFIAYVGADINKNYKIKKGDSLKFNTVIPISVEYNGTILSQTIKSKQIGEEFKVNLKAFGVIPLSSVNVEVVDELYVSVLGKPFGMKLYTDGVLVIQLSPIETNNGTINPAEKGGIKKGDYIISVNNQKIYTNEDLAEIVKNSEGKQMHFVIARNGKKLNKTVSAIFCSDTNSYKIGLWVRDSSAGIGTLTFYSPYSGILCGLGHGVCDEDTGELLKLNSGEIVSAEILSVSKGEVGSPGELKGRFTSDSYGKIDENNETGVYGFLKGKLGFSELTEVALKQEVRSGPAEIICTINGSEPKKYACEVKVRGSALLSSTQNLYITVTDKELLNSTGGIVQGMSGSPIIQNGKLIGAVTHVLIDNPKSGYGIFAENMLSEMYQISPEEVIKQAS